MIGLRRTALWAVAAVLLLGGCANEHMMTVSEPPPVAAPLQDKATVVFLRPTTFGGAVSSSVFEITQGGSKLVGILTSHKKLAYVSDPGNRRFMVIGENADFMDADLLPGRTYFARVRPRMGLLKTRFGLEAVANAATDPDLAEDLSGCVWVDNTPSSLQWAQANMASVLEKQASYLPEWQARKDRPSLKATDGR
jgi:hypothetical protein